MAKGDNDGRKDNRGRPQGGRSDSQNQNRSKMDDDGRKNGQGSQGTTMDDEDKGSNNMSTVSRVFV